MGKTVASGFGCAGFHAVKALRENSPDAETGVYFTAWEAPAFASGGKMDKCDGCEVRLENGLQHMSQQGAGLPAGKGHGHGRVRNANWRISGGSRRPNYYGC